MFPSLKGPAAIYLPQLGERSTIATLSDDSGKRKVQTGEHLVNSHLLPAASQLS
jgi:hypothetical protein